MNENKLTIIVPQLRRLSQTTRLKDLSEAGFFRS